MDSNALQSIRRIQQPELHVALAIVLVAALVLVLEAVFVMSTGWNFAESIIGGRITRRTGVLFLLMLPTTATTMYRFAMRSKAYRIGFVTCVVVFAALACWFSVEFFR